MAVNFQTTTSFEEARSQIEDHLFDSVMKIENDHDRAVESVIRFSEAIDRLAETLEQMFQAPPIDRSH